MCAFCVVPFTVAASAAGRFQHLAEAQELYERGYREVTLLEPKRRFLQMDQAKDRNPGKFRPFVGNGGPSCPDLRVRFSTSHPKDITNEVLHTIAKYPNISKYIHLPVQSGNSNVWSA
nr:hypothetical protein [Haliscomenobacter sp.]